MDELPLFYYLAGVPCLGILAQWLAWRFRLPAILLLLIFGVLLGWFVPPDQMLADVTGADASVGPRLLFPFVSLSVAVILFEGGLTLKFSELQSSGNVVLRLVSVGALVTWILSSLAAWWLLELDGRVAALLGAVLVVTGPTVVMPLLRHIRPSRKIGSVVKWEGITIDPVGAVLAVLVFEDLFVHAATGSGWVVAAHLAKTLAIGVVGGVGMALLLAHCLRRYWLPDFLHGVAFLTVALGAFAISNWLQEESGLVTVTLLGVMLANQKGIRTAHVLEFKEQLGILLISCLFIILGSRLPIDDLLEVGPRGLLFLVVLILVVRPLAVFASTWGSKLTYRERWFLSFLAPRGIVAAAVSSVFALKLATLTTLEPGLAEQAQQLVPLTFLVIVGTVSIYGLLAGPLARRLGLADPNPQGILFAGAEPWVRELAKVIHQEGFAVMLVDTNYRNVTEARMGGLPADCSSILSEHVREELELSGIGCLMALTANDEINTLAVREFEPLFGRANVFQLPPADSRTGKRVSIAHRLRGRLLFDQRLHHDYLAERAAAGAIVKKTTLTESFQIENFMATHGPSAVVLLSIDENRRLQVSTIDRKLEPRPGQTVIALVDPA